MDTPALVNDALELIEALDKKGFISRVAMLIEDEDTHRWKLWIVPSEKLKDRFKFYFEISAIIAEDRNGLSKINIEDIVFRSLNHPIIKAVCEMISYPGGKTIVRLSNNYVNGVYVPECYVLRTPSGLGSKRSRS